MFTGNNHISSIPIAHAVIVDQNQYSNGVTSSDQLPTRSVSWPAINEGGAREYLSSYRWPIGLQDTFIRNLCQWVTCYHILKFSLFYFNYLLILLLPHFYPHIFNITAKIPIRFMICDDSGSMVSLFRNPPLLISSRLKSF